MVRLICCIALILCSLITVTNSNAEDTIVNVYDNNGNLTTGDGRYYEYNDANQLAKVRQGDQTGPVIAEYFYDSSGQRIKKIENGVATYYVGKHYEKQVGGTNEGSTSYYFGGGGERVAKKDPAGNISYYHLDHLDGINAVTDSAGTLVSKTDYLPFGDVRTGSSGTEKYSYTDKEKDKTDLYYFNARYNSPEFRHFTQADLAEPDYADPQDLNRYAYVGNNPLSYVDDDGFKKKKKAKLSKREKWMIAHGADPDHDKTTLKKAKAQFNAGTKYTATTKSTITTTRSIYDPTGVEESSTLTFNTRTSAATLANYSTNKTGIVRGASTYREPDYKQEARDQIFWIPLEMVAEVAHVGTIFTIKTYLYDVPDKLADVIHEWTPVIHDIDNIKKGQSPQTWGGNTWKIAQCNSDPDCIFGEH